MWLLDPNSLVSSLSAKLIPHGRQYQVLLTTRDDLGETFSYTVSVNEQQISSV